MFFSKLVISSFALLSLASTVVSTPVAQPDTQVEAKRQLPDVLGPLSSLQSTITPILATMCKEYSAFHGVSLTYPVPSEYRIQGRRYLWTCWTTHWRLRYFHERFVQPYWAANARRSHSRGHGYRIGEFTPSGQLSERRLIP